MGPQPGIRHQRIDALRGLAVFGILLINVWGFVYGYTALRYGVLAETASNWDRLAVFLCAAFAEQKFYPIFAFLFGAGFGLQIGSLIKQAGLEDARRLYRRRLAWLLACGVLHAVLLWFGDILSAYALTGFWLLRLAGQRLSQVCESLRFVVIVNAMLLLVMALLAVAAASLPEELAEMVGATLRAHAVYTQGSWRELAWARLQDFGANVGGFWLFLPRLALFFLLGLLAVRLGWLTKPERHRARWRAILAAALVAGLPLNLWWGKVALDGAVNPYGASASALLASLAIDLAGPLLGAGYVAAVMLAAPRALAVLAPVGRMALTNYLMQSLICTLLLQGYGLGLGAVLPRAHLLTFSAGVMLFQLALSHWWLRHVGQGPAEALWRRHTYARLY
jgi:uncharacterized protein